MKYAHKRSLSEYIQYTRSTYSQTGIAGGILIVECMNSN